MARVTYGPLVTQLNGSIGGITFQTNRAGAIARLRPASFKSRSNEQNTEISNFTSLINGYQALTLAQKIDWDAFASIHEKVTKWGELRTLTGQNWYTAINAKREVLSLARLDDPPLFTLPAGNSNFTLSLSATSIEATKAVPVDPVNTSLLWWATPPLRTTTASIRSSLRFLTAQQTQPFGLINLTTFWESQFGCSWPPPGPSRNFNIFVALQIVRESSGLTSALNIQVATLEIPPLGVGFQIVGSTNIIG